MSSETLKSFAAIHDDYAFFEAHATEVEGTLAAWLPLVEGRWRQLHALDFGAGSGSFTSSFLEQAAFDPQNFHLTIVEPDQGFREQALTDLRPFSFHPIQAWPLLDRDVAPIFDLIFSHHVLYYVPDLEIVLARLVGALKTGGRMLVVQGGAGNGLNQLVWSAFERIGEKAPYNYSEDTSAILSRRGIDFDLQAVHSTVEFPDNEENCWKILRFLLGEHLAKLSPEEALSLYTPFVKNGIVRFENADELFVING